MKTVIKFSLLLLIILALISCTVPADDEKDGLSAVEKERASLAVQFVNTSSSDIASTAISSTTSMTRVTYANTLDLTMDSELGGSMAIVGDYTFEGDLAAGTSTSDISITYSNYIVDLDGEMVTYNGGPITSTSSATISFSNGSMKMTGNTTLNGSATITSDTYTGRIEYKNVSYSLNTEMTNDGTQVTTTTTLVVSGTLIFDDMTIELDNEKFTSTDTTEQATVTVVQ